MLRVVEVGCFKNSAPWPAFRWVPVLVSANQHDLNRRPRLVHNAWDLAECDRPAGGD